MDRITTSITMSSESQTTAVKVDIFKTGRMFPQHTQHTQHTQHENVSLLHPASIGSSGSCSASAGEYRLALCVATANGAFVHFSPEEFMEEQINKHQVALSFFTSRAQKVSQLKLRRVQTNLSRKWQSIEDGLTRSKEQNSACATSQVRAWRQTNKTR